MAIHSDEHGFDHLLDNNSDEWMLDDINQQQKRAFTNRLGQFLIEIDIIVPPDELWAFVEAVWSYKDE